MSKTAGDPWSRLEQSWYYLGRSLEGVLDVAVLETSGQRALPLFGSHEGAAPFLDAAPASLQVHELTPGDHRGKEELLRAALEQGATRVLFDPREGDLRSEDSVTIAQALWYILSMRRSSACL